jgi:zinc/manganese transport system permease protein
MSALADILLPACIAGMLVLATHVPLGQLVLARGIIFIDLAIAQVAGLGVIAADVAGFEARGLSVQVSALAAALAAAMLLIWTERHHTALQEAIIGVVYAVAASAQIILLGFDPHGAEHLKDLLVGQILWVSLDELWPVALLYAAVLAVWRALDLARRRAAFYAVFAVTITASVQLVGIFLVFATLIVPALAVATLAPRRRLAAGYSVGLLGYAIGLIVSALADVPTGAAVVCALALVAIVVALVRSALPSRPSSSPARDRS